VDATDILIESFDGEGFDPVLCAEDKPDRFSTVITKKGALSASVKVMLFFGGVSKDVDVNLIKDGAKWKITEISCDMEDGEVTDSRFQKEGYLNFEDENWVLVYEEPGSPALTVELELEENAMCIDDGIRTLCFASSFDEGLRVKVSGEEDDGKVIVKEIEFVRETTIQGTVVNADEENSHLIIMSQDGVEVIPIRISSETAFFGLGEPDSREFGLGDINQGDVVVVKGWVSAVGFNATSVEVTESADAQSMRATGSAGIEN
jgi:hypothetical protein